MLIEYNCSCNHQAGRWFGAQKDFTVNTTVRISARSSSVKKILIRICDVCLVTVPTEKNWTDRTPYSGPAEEANPPPPIICSVEDCKEEAGSGGFCDACRCTDCDKEALHNCVNCDFCCKHFDCPACSQHKLKTVKCYSCLRCNGCCDCFTCAACTIKQVITEKCPHCNKCLNCCLCEICSECTSPVHRNDTCGCCDDHCECASNRRGYGGPWRADLPKHRIGFNSTRLAGVEWEFNTALLFNKLGPWTRRWHGGIHDDGSCGKEIVTSPMAGDHISKCLTDLGQSFKDAGATIDGRCGIHVHVDACDVTWADMYRLLWLYSHVEPILYMLAGQQRASNTYCMPCGEAYKKAMSGVDRKGGVLEVAFSSARSSNSGRSHQRQNPGKKDSGRYRGLNLCPWLAGRKNKAPDTTLEFRLHSNSSEADRVINWTQLCVRMVDWAVKSTDNDALELPKSALRTLCKVVAPECEPYIMKCLKEWRKKYKGAARLVGTEHRRIRYRGGRYSLIM
jgi:hypothetical protein